MNSSDSDTAVTECSARSAGSFSSRPSYLPMGYLSYLINSKISGFSRSLFFMRSFMAVMMLFALSSAPCFELFSAAPTERHSYILCIKYVNWECSVVYLSVSLSVSTHVVSPKSTGYVYIFVFKSVRSCEEILFFVHVGYTRLKYNFLKLYTALRSVSEASSTIRRLSVGQSINQVIFFYESVSHSNSVTSTANH